LLGVVGTGVVGVVLDDVVVDDDEVEVEVEVEVDVEVEVELEVEEELEVELGVDADVVVVVVVVVGAAVDVDVDVDVEVEVEVGVELDEVLVVPSDAGTQLDSVTDTTVPEMFSCRASCAAVVPDTTVTSLKVSGAGSPASVTLTVHDSVSADAVGSAAMAMVTSMAPAKRSTANSLRLLITAALFLQPLLVRTPMRRNGNHSRRVPEKLPAGRELCNAERERSRVRARSAAARFADQYEAGRHS
jgi:hypothetical protein